MRTGFTGIAMGLAVAISLKNEKNVTSQNIVASLTTEMLFIIISGLSEIS